ncbi:MAG: PstS family phosphate ABC transporter substrate-binding protein [Thiolinea sp.]
MKLSRFYMSLLGSLFLAISVSSAEISLPEGMTSYVELEQKEAVTGEITAIGSSRVGPIIHSVLEVFTAAYPDVNFQVEQEGSGAAIQALLNRKANIGLMSRRIKTEEVNKFVDRRGYPPTELRVASDALRIIVNRHNPVNQLSMAELEAIFSKERLCGAAYSLDSWEDFGWVADTSGTFSTITRHISAEGTGPRDLIQKIVLCDGEFKDWSIESATTDLEVVRDVALSHNAIGFAALGFQEFGIKDLFVSRERLHPGYKPTTENIINRRYPLSRYLYVYIDKPPTSDMPLLFREFFKFLFSKQGQEIVVSHNAIPLSHRLIRDELIKLIQR